MIFAHICTDTCISPYHHIRASLWRGILTFPPSCHLHVTLRLSSGLVHMLLTFRKWSMQNFLPTRRPADYSLGSTTIPNNIMEGFRVWGERHSVRPLQFCCFSVSFQSSNIDPNPASSSRSDQRRERPILTRISLCFIFWRTWSIDSLWQPRKTQDFSFDKATGESHSLGSTAAIDHRRLRFWKGDKFVHSALIILKDWEPWLRSLPKYGKYLPYNYKAIREIACAEKIISASFEANKNQSGSFIRRLGKKIICTRRIMKRGFLDPGIWLYKSSGD